MGEKHGPMPRPTPGQLSVLGGFERVAFETGDLFNRNPWLKRLGHAFLSSVGAGWVHLCTRNLIQVDGLEAVRALAPDRGVLLVANHRSFFDCYVLSCLLLRETSWIREMYFPVRSTFFYERPDGILVNAVMSAMAMYPPVLRDPSKRRFNEFAVEAMVDRLRVPGAVVGMHPEGTRGKGPDPYALLPAQPGVGEMVHRARPIVLPAFVLGLTNDLASQVRGNFNRKGNPVTLVFGEPVDFGPLLDEEARPRTYRAIADRVRDVLVELGRRERRLRAARGLPPAF